MARAGDSLATVIQKVLPQDVLASVLTAVIWQLTGIADAVVLLGLAVVRMIVWISWARSRFAPLRTWEREAGSDDASVRAAAELLGRLKQELLPRQIGLWAVALLLGTIVHCFDRSGALVVGRAELVLAVLLTTTALVALTVLESMIIDGAVLDGQLRIGRELMARGLQIERPPSHLSHRMVRVLIGLSMLIAMIMASVGASMWVGKVRELELSQQQRRAELAAVYADHGALERIDADIELVAAAQLPTELSEPSTDSVGTRTAIDPAHERVLAAAPLADGRYALAIATPDEHLGRVLLIVLAVVGVVIARVASAANVLARMVVLQIETIGATMRRVIESGNVLGDERVPTLENDEVGQLGALFNQMLDMLAELAAAAEAVAAGDLRVELARRGDLFDAFRGMLANLREIVGEIRRTTVELASTTAELHAMTIQQQNATEQQSERMAAVVRMLGVLSSSANEMAEVANGVFDNADQTAAMTDDATAKIVELGRQTRKIGELLGLIREIADRSDLLALNGALEATRAGEAGRGFELVAAEMRRLAERVAKAVDDVSGRVAEIDRSSAATIKATRESRQLAQNTAEAAKLISSVTNEQTTDTQALVTTVDATNEAMTATVASLQQTLAAVGDIRHEAERLETLTRHFTLD